MSSSSGLSHLDELEAEYVLRTFSAQVVELIREHITGDDLAAIDVGGAARERLSEAGHEVPSDPDGIVVASLRDVTCDAGSFSAVVEGSLTVKAETAAEIEAVFSGDVEFPSVTFTVPLPEQMVLDVVQRAGDEALAPVLEAVEEFNADREHAEDQPWP